MIEQVNVQLLKEIECISKTSRVTISQKWSQQNLKWLEHQAQRKTQKLGHPCSSNQETKKHKVVKRKGPRAQKGPKVDKEVQSDDPRRRPMNKSSCR